MDMYHILSGTLPDDKLVAVCGEIIKSVEEMKK